MAIMECSFFIPVLRDAILSDGLPHKLGLIDSFVDVIYDRFEGLTIDPNRYQGVYKDPDTKERVNDESHRFVVAVSEEKLDELRSLLREACDWFKQKCIYLSIAGEVEFISSD